MRVEEVSELYKLYGFEEEERAENGEYVVFSYDSGLFINIEIAVLSKSKKVQREVQKTKEEYANLGYSTIEVYNCLNFTALENRLFNAFFHPERSKMLLKEEYNKFCKQQSEKLQGDFQYIPGKFQDSTAQIKTGLVDDIVGTRALKQSRLTIMEAAAGYGKTCTVYEIINDLANQDDMQIPLFVELSKNRNARLFRYVIQDEIDKKFTKLSSKLIIREIEKGRIPLVIDGFDELIEQRGEVLEDSDERSLSMLSTIVELLGNNSHAWILLTSRNSAIFSGDLFDEWVMSKLGENCVVDRVRIIKPSAKEWLPDRYEIIRESGINIDQIANPVLLTFLKNINIEKLKEFNDSRSIFQQYLTLLLNRDRERLNLLLEREEQYEILKLLAGNFVQYDITCENIDFIQDLVRNILEDRLPELMERYKEADDNEVTLQTEQEYVQRLSHSCLLDRISISENQLGFINEFVLGILAGDAVLAEDISAKDVSERYIEIISTAYEGEHEDVRFKLYQMLTRVDRTITTTCRLNMECMLLHSIGSDYHDQYFHSFVFSEIIKFNGNYKFVKCTFDNCLFQNCTINASVFESCLFYNCRFYDISVEGKANEDLLFINCEGEDKLNLCNKELIEVDNVDEYERTVLEQFWKPGYSSAELRRTYTALFKGINPKEQGCIQQAIRNLLKKGLIKELNICYELNTSKLGEIKHILGRG